MPTDPRPFRVFVFQGGAYALDRGFVFVMSACEGPSATPACLACAPPLPLACPTSFCLLAAGPPAAGADCLGSSRWIVLAGPGPL